MRHNGQWLKIWSNDHSNSNQKLDNGDHRSPQVDADFETDPHQVVAFQRRLDSWTLVLENMEKVVPMAGILFPELMLSSWRRGLVG